jgi:choline dehydrogenase-like flavoprotein
LIRDLNQADEGGAGCNAQVCIVGAGTAGIYLAQELRKLGLQVVMLEAGDALARMPEEIGQLCQQRGIRYRGADLGRSFGLGGTSALWGGQMIPLAESDMGPRSAVGFDAWPIGYAEVAAYFQVVRQQLGLGGRSGPSVVAHSSLLASRFSALLKLGRNFDLRLSEWLPFKKRNFAKAFADTLAGDTGLTVWLNASVVDMNRSNSSGNSQIESITARSPNGRTLVVRPSVVVICAGALESTRLLLEFDEATGGSVTNEGAPLGRYFADHLSVTCGRFICRDWRRYNLAVGPIFENGVMRTPRMELTGLAQQELGLTSAFAHFTFVTQGNTGFDVVRSVLRRRQGGQQSLGLTPSLLWRVVTDVTAMAFWRGLHRRLWIPRKAELLLQVDIEQTPNAASRLTLSEERDTFNRKRLVIDWQITSDDVRVIRKVAEVTIDAWQGSPLREVAELELTLPDEFDSFATLYDVYHPTGSLRMGTSAANSVVDKDLRLWKTDNCYVTTTAVFPSAGSANPGLTHLALTARLAAHIGKRLGKTASTHA